MKSLLLIGAGGCIGSVLRYVISQSIQGKILTAFPFGTLTVNLLGCFVIGILFQLSEMRNLTPEWRLFFATGICGGFTTFSAFSQETISLIQNALLLPAIVYVAMSILLGLLALLAGIWLTRILC